MKYFLTALFILFSQVLSADEIQWRTYTLKSFPVSAQGCQERAKSLGEDFLRVTGHSVFRTVCEKSSSGGQDIVITYVAASSMPLVSTADESGGSGYLGIYTSLADCEKNLAGEIKIFKEATGLSPLVSYCYRESQITATPFMARIDAWGEAKALPYRFEKSLFVDKIPGSEEVLKTVVTSAKKSGASAYQATFAHDGSLKLVIRYYGASGAEIHDANFFRLNEIARYSSLGTRYPMEACRQQLKEAEAGFSTAFSTPAIWFCGWDSFLFDAKLYVIRIRPTAWIQSKTLPDRYLSFSDCQKEIPTVKAWYQKTIGIVPFAVLCSWKSYLGTGKADAFVMRVLTKSDELELPWGPEWGSER